jgi:hypothetical protein
MGPGEAKKNSWGPDFFLPRPLYSLYGPEIQDHFWMTLYTTLNDDYQEADEIYEIRNFLKKIM